MEKSKSCSRLQTQLMTSRVHSNRTTQLQYFLEATDPNIIHDLERDVFGFKLFSELEMSGLVEELYSGTTLIR